MFRITAALRSVCDITPTMLQHFGIRGLLLDLDNTLTTHDNPPSGGGRAGLDCSHERKWHCDVYCIQQPSAQSQTVCRFIGAALCLRGKETAFKGVSGGKSRYGTSLERTGGCWRPDFYGCAGGKPQTVEMYFRLSDCTRANPVFPVQTANGSPIPSP